MSEIYDAFIKAFDADDPDIVKQLRTAVSSDMDEYDFRDDLMLNAAHEIERLRALITGAFIAKWVDVEDQQVTNVITAELGTKASTPDDIANALRKAVGR